MPHSQNPGFPRTRRRNRFDGQGCYAPNSSTPPWGWFPTFAIAIPAVIAAGGLFAFGPALLTYLVGA